MSIVAVSCQIGSHQAYGASEHFILFQLVGRGKDGRWWIAAPVIFCIEKFSTLKTKEVRVRINHRHFHDFQPSPAKPFTITSNIPSTTIADVSTTIAISMTSN